MNTRKTFNAVLTSLLLSVAILVEPAYAAASRAGFHFPPTAAGKLAELRLKAFNSGKAEKLAAFKRAHDPQLSVEDELDLRQMTGGLDAIRIEHSDALRLTVMLRERGGDRVGKMMLELDPNNPNRLASFSLQPLPEVPPDLMSTRLSSAAAWRLLQTKANTMAQQERFAGSVAVARHGVISHEQSWGDADRTTHLKNTSATRFRIASMYKMLTTVAVLQLVEQQRIDLDAPLIRYLPSYPNRSLAEQVSIFLKQADQLRPSVERQDASQEDEAMALQLNSCIDLRLDFERAMQNLNATEQLVLLHCVQLDLTHEEVAQVLGLPLGTVKSNATRGKSKLQAWLSAWMQTSKKSSDQGSTS